MPKPVLFIQGGGLGAHTEDAPLATSLQRALGPDYLVRYPRMPNEADPDPESWKKQIATELAALDGEVILVGHSVGATTLLKYLAEEKVDRPIAGVFLLAAPSWDEHNWNFDDLKLPDDLAAKLLGIPRTFLYHSRDDEVVPFAHLALHAARLPRATVRESDGRGHQFGNDLSDVARDIDLPQTRIRETDWS
jgi:predicted alpha/beta hydrolase family esterase